MSTTWVLWSCTKKEKKNYFPRDPFPLLLSFLPVSVLWFFDVFFTILNNFLVRLRSTQVVDIVAVVAEAVAVDFT